MREYKGDPQTHIFIKGKFVPAKLARGVIVRPNSRITDDDVLKKRNFPKVGKWRTTS